MVDSIEDTTYYFEFSDRILDMKLAPAKYGVINGERLHKYREYTWNSQRIWVEDSNGVHYIKNRMGIVNNPIDEKEFMWIKLKAQDLK